MLARSRRIESLVYATIWLIVIILYLLDILRARAAVSAPLFDSGVAVRIVVTLIPYMLLWGINNYILIPRLFLKNHLLKYFLLVAAILIVLDLYQYYDFMSHHRNMPDPFDHQASTGKVHPRPLLPLPLFLDFSYGLLIIGGNLAIALMFQRFDDILERESLMKINAQNELAYLRAQINPHFYMNMLNNIHGMIDINQEKAQEMVLDMSRLMRYMLYDSSRPETSLANEIEFIQNYLRLMRIRYPENRVTISASFPSDQSLLHSVMLPPLLFLVFIENAFKHGISYRQKSFVAISIEIQQGRLCFCCMNTRHNKISNKADRSKNDYSGIGLANIKQRLALLYGSGATLEIEETSTTYTVNLSFPIHDNKNIGN